MINPLAWLKYRLSHVSARSLHFRMTKELWGERVYGKSCAYYWCKLPLAIIGWILIVALYILIGTALLFSGRIMNLNNSDPDFSYGYKRLPNRKKVPIAIWEVVTVVVLLLILRYFVVFNPHLGFRILLWGITVCVCVCIAAGIFFVISKGLKNTHIAHARANIVNAWNNACPQMEVEGGDKASE